MSRSLMVLHPQIFLQVPSAVLYRKYPEDFSIFFFAASAENYKYAVWMFNKSYFIHAYMIHFPLVQPPLAAKVFPRSICSDTLSRFYPITVFSRKPAKSKFLNRFPFCLQLLQYCQCNNRILSNRSTPRVYVRPNTLELLRRVGQSVHIGSLRVCYIRFERFPYTFIKGAVTQTRSLA